jgi:hypothetical protein
MPTVLRFCNSASLVEVEKSSPNAAMLTIPAGNTKRADTFVGSTKASLATISGADANGDIDIEACCGGTHGNSITYEQVTGPTGAGNEDLALRMDVSGQDVSVKFATDGSGNSVTPTAAQVAALVSGMLKATAGGTGASTVGTQVQTTLTGGLDDGDIHVFDGKVPVLRTVASVEVT